MRRVSPKRQQRIAEARPVRQGLLERFPWCWACGHSPRNPWRYNPRECSALCVHEISRGPLREKSLDKLYCLLVTCSWCNCHELTDRSKWPEAKQLAVLLATAPEHYDLAAYLRLTSPAAPLRIEQHEVDFFLTQLALRKAA